MHLVRHLLTNIRSRVWIPRTHIKSQVWWFRSRSPEWKVGIGELEAESQRAYWSRSLADSMSSRLGQRLCLKK